jgi:long-subunit fatty acid transport protein
MKKITTSILFSFLFTYGFAQNDGDMLRYSMLNYGGTSRSLGMANSFGALGADMSSTATNPAGLGMFRSGEISLSLGFHNRFVNDQLFNKNKESTHFKMAFSNAGMSWHFENQNYSKWKGWTFAMAYNQTNNFSSDNFASGFNGNNSILHSFCEELGKLDPTLNVVDNIQTYSAYTAYSAYNGDNAAFLTSDYPFDVDLAWQTFLIDSVNSDAGQTYYFNAVPFGGVQQSKRTRTRGGQGEFDITLANNFENKLFFGLTIGFASVNFSQTTNWREYDSEDSIPGFYSLDYNTELNTTGSAVNFKFGVIYKPIDAMRIGIAFHTPSSYLLTDDYSSTINAKLESSTGGIIENDYASPLSIPFQYRIMTPLKLITSIAGLTSKVGAVNLDYEYNDYSKGSVYSNDASINPFFNDAREAIKIKYQATHTIRIGAEAILNNWRVRAGASYATSPFKSQFRLNTFSDLSRKTFTTGFGYKGERYFFDMALAYSTFGSVEKQYTLENGNEGLIESNYSDTRVLFTVGKKF